MSNKRKKRDKEFLQRKEKKEMDEKREEIRRKAMQNGNIEDFAEAMGIPLK